MALAGEAAGPAAAPLAGADEPVLVRSGFELPVLLLAGAARDESSSDVPDCWNGAGSAGPLQAASAAMGIRTNHDERWTMS